MENAERSYSAATNSSRDAPAEQPGGVDDNAGVTALAGPPVNDHN